MKIITICSPDIITHTQTLLIELLLRHIFWSAVCLSQLERVLIFMWAHQSLQCWLWEECTHTFLHPSVHLSPLTSIKHSNRQSKPVPLLREWFQMGMNILSRHPCVIPLHWGKTIYFCPPKWDGAQLQWGHVFRETTGQRGTQCEQERDGILWPYTWSEEIW